MMMLDKLVIGDTGTILYISSSQAHASPRYLPKCDVARFGNMEDGFRELIVFDDDPRWMMRLAHRFVAPVFSEKADRRIAMGVHITSLGAIAFGSALVVNLLLWGIFG